MGDEYDNEDENEWAREHARRDDADTSHAAAHLAHVSAHANEMRVLQIYAERPDGLNHYEGGQIYGDLYGRYQCVDTFRKRSDGLRKKRLIEFTGMKRQGGTSALMQVFRITLLGRMEVKS